MAGNLSIRSLLRRARALGRERFYTARNFAPGSKGWLIQRELLYGGLVTDVPRLRVSPMDPRSTTELATGGMIGGDRMLRHGYAPVYEKYLRTFIGDPGLTLAEFGILKGSGLAIWCDLFPQARCIGFDIDLGHTENNMPFLRSRGAFGANTPELHQYDQFVDGTEFLAELLPDGVDIVIDDGLHALETIVTTFKSVQPYLAKRFVYFVEDYPGLLNDSGNLFDAYDSQEYGQLTVISSGV